MFIFVIHRDTPELSLHRISSMTEEDEDLCVEKTLLVNPDCPVRIMLEYIRKKCKLGIYTKFDLCDEGGALKGLFNLPTYAYATDSFVHKQTYYIIVLRQDTDNRRLSTLPQLNHENKLYQVLKERVGHFLSGSGTDASTSTTRMAPAGSAAVKSTVTAKAAPVAKKK